ncbi:MAG TPA: hypothetical protein VF403_20905 [Kofleriaceae bacterium]
MDRRPSIDEILAKGRGRQKRLELWLGVLVLAGGLAFRLGIAGLTSREMTVATYGVIAFGVVLIARGLFGQGRGDELPSNAVLRSLDSDQAHARPRSKHP